jgi:hypothetical protein
MKLGSEIRLGIELDLMSAEFEGPISREGEVG